MASVHHLIPAIPTASEASHEWLTAAEIAEMALPGLPTDKRSVNRRARDERWALRHDGHGSPLSRPRVGRGGGTEFHVSLLPGEARVELAKRGIGGEVDEAAAKEMASQARWRWYDAQSAKTKAEAERRRDTIEAIALLEASGLTRSASVSAICQERAIGKATAWNWLKSIEGIARTDWIPALAPRRTGGGSEIEVDAFLWNLFKSDYLRASCPTLASCYYRTAEVARERGLAMPSERTLRRKLEREVDHRVIILRRKGEEALRRSQPSQRRSIDELHALELVNVDGHKFDVFAKLPDGRVIRPIMVAIQDVYSSKILAWRIDETESAVLTRLAFADLFRNFGIPKAVLMDNGRAFASKWITGGAKSRFRFKIKAEEPTGVLTALGIAIHWALPYRGQSKPIERAFRDLCDSVARRPAFEGAYTGNRPDAKPENYGSRAVPFDEFLAEVAKGIASHNARLGRRGRNYGGRSFDQVFAESYAVAPIGKATPEQLRLTLHAAEQRRVDRLGIVELMGNRYFADGSSQFAGQRVTVRFDPDNLHSQIHLYGQDGRFLMSCDLQHDTGFRDVEEARRSAKRTADLRKAVRAAAEAEELMAAEEVARHQAAIEVPELPEPTTVRPVRHRGQTAAALKVVPPIVSEKEQVEERNADRLNRFLVGLKLVE